LKNKEQTRCLAGLIENWKGNLLWGENPGKEIVITIAIYQRMLKKIQNPNPLYILRKWNILLDN
jgi:hypothetical protein